MSTVKKYITGADVPEPAHQLDIAVELTDALTRANVAEAKLSKVR